MEADLQVDLRARKAQGPAQVIAAVILAAGASRRMGSPKALLNYRGETFLNRLIRVLGAVCDPVVVVLGHHAQAIQSVADNQALYVINPDPDRGQLSSLQTGLAALPPAVDGFLFVPVDCPTVEEPTLALLLRAFDRRDPQTKLVIPRYQGKRGHPVVAAAALLGEFLALPEGAQAKQIVHRLVPETQYVDVTDPGVLADIDDHAAYQALQENAR
jgi:molybdenum cofactor cytidylyltransferase